MLMNGQVSVAEALEVTESMAAEPSVEYKKKK